MGIVAYAWWFQEPVHTHMSCLLKYCHLFCCCSLLHVAPVRNLLTHIHDVQGLVSLFSRMSSKLTAQLCDVKFFRRFIKQFSEWVLGVVTILLLNVMEVFSVGGGALLDIPCMVFQRMCGLCL